MPTFKIYLLMWIFKHFKREINPYSYLPKLTKTLGEKEAKELCDRMSEWVKTKKGRREFLRLTAEEPKFWRGWAVLAILISIAVILISAISIVKGR